MNGAWRCWVYICSQGSVISLFPQAEGERCSPNTTVSTGAQLQLMCVSRFCVYVMEYVSFPESSGAPRRIVKRVMRQREKNQDKDLRAQTVSSCRASWSERKPLLFISIRSHIRLRWPNCVCFIWACVSHTPSRIFACTILKQYTVHWFANDIYIPIPAYHLYG